MNRLLTFFILTILGSVVLHAQPRVEEERPLVRALREAEVLYRQGSYSAASALVEGALDSAAPADDRADALHLLVRSDMASGRYARLLVSTQRFLEYAPADRRALEVLYDRGVALYEDGNRTDAESAFRRVAEAHAEQEPQATYWIGRILADRNKVDSAGIFADRSRAFGRHDLSDDALFLAAWVREGRDQIDSAAALYKTILADYPGSDLALDAQLRLGVIEARRGFNESALTLLNSLTPATERQREEQLFYQAEVSSALGRDEDALRHYGAFLQSFPRSIRNRSARYGYGWSQLRLKRWDDAIATLRQLEDGLDSIAAAASYQIGAVQMLRGDTANALRAFQSVIFRLPYESFSDNAYFQIGKIFYRRAQYDSARHYLLITARQYPESELRSEAYYLLGESYAALDQYANAQNSFMRAQQTGATGDLLERSLYREGVMLYRVGRFKSAIDRLRSYVSQHPKGEQIADATFWLGEALYQDRSYDEAERYYGAVVDKYASSRWREEATYGLAWARFQQKDFKGASRTFADFVKSFPNSEHLVEASIRLADAYRFLGQYDKAISTYESVGGAAAGGARAEEARYRLAGAFFEMGDVERSVQTFRELIRLYPSSPRRDVYAFNIGSIYREKGMDSLAIGALGEFVEKYPESQFVPQAVFSIGDAYYNLQQFDSSYAYYLRVLDQYPNSTVVPEALDAVRFSLEALGRGGEAIAVIDSFTVRNPNRLPADSLLYRKGNILFDQGDYPAAIAVYRKIVDDTPESPLVDEALFQVGHAHQYLGHPDTAITFYSDVVTRFPQGTAAPKALAEEAALRFKAGQIREAADAYRTFIERYQTSERLGEVRYGLAQASLRLGDTATAETQFRAVLDSSSGASEDDISGDRSRVGLARILAARKDAAGALELLASVAARRMDDIAAEALLLRGELLVATNDLAGALSELRRLTTDFTDYPEYVEPGMMLLGGVYEQLTNWAAAREVYERLIATTGDAKLKADAQARLKKLKRS